MTTTKQVCSVCGVTIDASEENPVQFSFGEPGTKNRLYARVCQFISLENKQNCLLKEDITKDNLSPQEKDYYDSNLRLGVK